MSNLLWTPRRVPVPGLGDLFSEACGPVDGLPVLLVMGAMNPRHMWPDGFVDALVQGGCRVLRYDHRDTGRSFTMPAGLPHYALDQLVADGERRPGAGVVGAGGAQRMVPALAAGMRPGSASASAPKSTSTRRWLVSTLPAATGAG